MALPSPEEQLLAPFSSTLGAVGAWEVALGTLQWLARQVPDLDWGRERRVPVLVTVACVYAQLCAPGGATVRETQRVASFTLLFFLVDDAALHELPRLLSADSTWSIGRYTPALRAWLADFEERNAASSTLVERFGRAYHDYLAARKAEPGHAAEPLDVEAHWAFRRRSIFMDPYLDLWMILRGVDPAELLTSAFDEARALAIDLVLLANDLGSVERDRQGGAAEGDLNLLHTYARVHAEPESEALERLVALYDDLSARYREVIARAQREPPSLSAERYADILTGVVEGNVRSVLALEFRYPGAAPIMQRLASAH